MTATDELLAHDAAYASSFTKGELPSPPAKQVAIVACMDVLGPRSRRAPVDRADQGQPLRSEEGSHPRLRVRGGDREAARGLLSGRRETVTYETVR